MTTNPMLGRWMMAYGGFLILMGVAGYLSNPEKAQTALISGGLFGGLSMAWGWCLSRGMAWAYWAACVTTTLLLGVFCWRATAGWMAVASGSGDKRVAAMLISCMGLASLAMVALLALRRRPAPSPA